MVTGVGGKVGVMLGSRRYLIVLATQWQVGVGGRQFNVKYVLFISLYVTNNNFEVPKISFSKILSSKEKCQNKLGLDWTKLSSSRDWALLQCMKLMSKKY